VSDDPEGDLVRALREKASVMKEDAFSIKHDDVVVQVRYSGGSSSSLTLFAGYDTFAKREHADGREGGSYRQTAVPRALSATRPMNITLRPEAYGDREAKAQGLNREHQTGDADFDNAVYIDSPTTDHEVLQAVLGEEARTAVRDLFALGLRRITIDDTKRDVEAYLNEFATAKERPGRADLMVDAFSRLVSSMPPVRDSGGVHAPAPFGCLMVTGGAFAGILGIAAIPLFLGIASAFDCTESSSDGEGTSLKTGCGGPPIMGLIIGIIAGLLAIMLARLLFTPRLRGRSNSASRLGSLTLISFALAAEVTFLVVTYAGYALR
jgi:hypothetical protein